MKCGMVPVFEAVQLGQCRQMVNARDLHAFLQVGRDFSTWIKGRIEEYGFERDHDYFQLDSPDLVNQVKRHGGDRRTIEYHLTIGMAKELAMVERTDVGRQVRRYFIDMEEKARALLEERANYVQPVEWVKKRLHDTPKLRYMLILQEQSRKIAKQLDNETTYGARFNLHCQLRQVNECLGLPTLPLEALEASISLPATL